MAGRKTKEEERALYSNIKIMHAEGRSQSEISRALKISLAMVQRHLAKLEKELDEMGIDNENSKQYEIALDLKQCRDRLRIELSKENTDSLLISRLTEREQMLQNALFNAQAAKRSVISPDELWPERTPIEREDLANQISDCIMTYTIDGNFKERIKTKSHWNKYL